MRLATIIGTAGLLLSTAAQAQDVTYDYDKSADFAALKTYAWVRGTPVGDELNHKRIVAAVDAQLAAKGLRPVEPGGTPDVLVAYHAIFGREVEVTGMSSGWGGYRWGAGRSGSARAQEILVGALVVDVVDARSRSIVWRGVASKEVDVKASPEKREKNNNTAAAKLFQHYPPAL
jgi:hypothetical protein